ncbi:MAG: hypothetical protein FJ265_03495 [Planctomycetes bacterium]|nr:hypothetical protein [Planctomycetota bacterium]
MFEAYVELSVAHPLWLAFVQFLLLGTLGEALSRMLRARSGRWPFRGRRLLLKALGWGLLGVYVKCMFTTAVAGVDAMVAQGYLPAAVASREGGWLVVNALAVSVVLNVLVGPSLMILHRLADHTIDRWLGGRSPGFAGLGASLATLLWLWIPLHTFTFCMPRDLRIGIAALWSLVLGVVMGACTRKAGER